MSRSSTCSATCSSSATPAPSARDAYLFLQTVLGAWPFAGIEGERDAFAERIAQYMRKATREAKLETSWLRPNPEYETAMDAFVRGMLSDPELALDMRSF